MVFFYNMVIYEDMMLLRYCDGNVRELLWVECSSDSIGATIQTHQEVYCDGILFSVLGNFVECWVFPNIDVFTSVT